MKQMKTTNYMALEEQVVSLELARRLKELGVPQESLFWWVEVWRYQVLDHYEIMSQRELDSYDSNECYLQSAAAAFTVAELGILLYSDANQRAYLDFPEPTRVDSRGQLVLRWKIPNDEEYSDWKGGLAPTFSEFVFSESEADARAKLMIYLIEHELINL